MEWRLKRVWALEPQWARFDELHRQWSWTADEKQAFVAHNRYIVEAMQRRAPDWLRLNSEIELCNGAAPQEEQLAERPAIVRKRKREDAAC